MNAFLSHSRLNIAKNAPPNYVHVIKSEYTGYIMAAISLHLGERWETFIKNEIASERYGSASEVVREALRAMEERQSSEDTAETDMTKEPPQ